MVLLEVRLALRRHRRPPRRVRQAAEHCSGGQLVTEKKECFILVFHGSSSEIMGD